MKEGYFVEWNGDCWQSVFPVKEAHLSQLHPNVDDAMAYMTEECGISGATIRKQPKKEE